jgi:hypothetical protein
MSQVAGWGHMKWITDFGPPIGEPYVNAIARPGTGDAVHPLEMETVR